MSLFKEWTDLIQGQTKGTIDSFWEEYAGAETRIYKHILANHGEHLKGTVSSLAKEFECREVIFTGFLDGINTSLKAENDLKSITPDSEIDLDIDFEKLYFNMHKADADYLWSLEEWDEVIPEDRRKEIYDDFRRSRTVHVEKKPGRNEPCPCGSGKKYKNCCGKRTEA